jgi:hypothetical protein
MKEKNGSSTELDIAEVLIQSFEGTKYRTYLFPLRPLSFYPSVKMFTLCRKQQKTFSSFFALRN